MTSLARAWCMESARRHLLPMAAIAIAYSIVATYNIGLPGIYADSINPDYLVHRILNPDAARSIVWVLSGNALLGDRAPVLISLYHGSQQFWLGLPLYAVFGTTLEGVRAVHATFALGVLVSLYVLLQRAAHPWLAAATCVALAIDPAFSFSFRTQAYITVAPAAWILLATWCLFRAGDTPEANARRWILASGVLCGVAAVGYFIWWFALPPIAVAAVKGLRKGVAAKPRTWLTWGSGVALGAVAYPVGYLLAIRKAGSLEGVRSFLAEQSARVDPFRSRIDVGDRLVHVGNSIGSVLDGSWHSTMMFNGDGLTVPGATCKIAILVALPVVIWIVAELRHTATPLQRLLVAIPTSFATLSLLFGDRLGGHHYSAMVPVLYASLGVGLNASARSDRRWSAAPMVLVLASLSVLSISAQRDFSDKLVATGGKGLLSDAIVRFAADVNATRPRPLLWFPDAVLALPLIMLTRGEVEMSDQLDDPAPLRRLCSGRDVWLVRIPDHASAPRGAQWLERVDWPLAAAPKVYAERDGTPVFEVVVLTGSPAACARRPGL